MTPLDDIDAPRVRTLRPFIASALIALSMTSGVASATSPDAFELSSPGLADNATLDSSHAASANDCGGGNISPALQWRHVPAGTKSYAITIFDPDGAKGLGIVHWVMYGIAPTTTALDAGAQPPAGSIAGTNRTGATGYYGPCPPIGEIPHHYVVQAYALDLAPDALPPALTRDALLSAMKSHVLAATSIVLRYGR